MSAKTWTFLSNHGHVLVHIAQHPEAKLREIAAAVGITERSTQSIISDLEEAGYLAITKSGRQNTYRINTGARFRHPSEAHHTIGELLAIFRDS